MNAIILSVIIGVAMMFCSVFVPNKNTYRHIATIGLFLLLIGNIAEVHGFSLFHINTRGMLSYDSFGMFFNSIAIASTLVYVLLTGRDIQKTGSYVAEYFVLLCAVRHRPLIFLQQFINAVFRYRSFIYSALHINRQ
jgi:NADH-quinone oxidoreductase subunit N